MFDEERADSIFRTFTRVLIPIFLVGMIFGALLTALILLI